jgi:hypothetical protein
MPGPEFAGEQVETSTTVRPVLLELIPYEVGPVHENESGSTAIPERRANTGDVVGKAIE